MKIAILNTHAGAPGTLASTAFIGAIMDGLANNGIAARAVGITRYVPAWRPQALQPFESSTPWLHVPPSTRADSVEAALTGVLDPSPEGNTSRVGDAGDWYLELLLQRDLVRFAGDDPELVVMVYPRSYPLLALAARIVRRNGWRLGVFSTEALTDLQIDPATRDDYVRCVAEQADAVWALSEHLGAFWRSRGVATERILVNPPAVREGFFAESESPRACSAVYIGNLQHREVDYLLKVAQVIKRELPEFRLAIYGDTSDERRAELFAEIAEGELTDTVTIMPSVPPADVPSVLATGDVMVLPRSRGEFSTAGFPNKLGEYLSSGRPVVVTAVGDIPTYLADNVSAFVVEPDDCRAFADAVVRALSDNAEADRIGAAGREVAARIARSTAVASRLLLQLETAPVRSKPPVPLTVRIRRLRTAASNGRTPCAHGKSNTSFRSQAADGVRRVTTVTLHWLRHAKSGHTRVVALKMCAMRVLRMLGLKPPAPGA